MMSKLTSNFDAIEGWVVVFNSSSEIEASLVQAFLSGANIETQIISQQDHMIPANAFDEALIHVLVQQEKENEAKALVKSFLEEGNSEQSSEGV